MDSRLTAVMSHMSLINLIEPGGGDLYCALACLCNPHPDLLRQTNFSFITLKIQVTVFMRIANLRRLEN